MDLEQGFSSDSCAALFRTAHNLKGTAKALGFEKFAHFVHKIEDIIDKLQSRKIATTPPIVELLLISQASILEWIREIAKDPTFDSPISIKELTETIDNLNRNERQKLSKLGPIDTLQAEIAVNGLPIPDSEEEQEAGANDLGHVVPNPNIPRGLFTYKVSTLQLESL